MSKTAKVLTLTLTYSSPAMINWPYFVVFCAATKPRINWRTVLEARVKRTPIPQGGKSLSEQATCSHATSALALKGLWLGATIKSLNFSFGLSGLSQRMKAPLVPIFSISATMPPWACRTTAGQSTSTLACRLLSLAISHLLCHGGVFCTSLVSGTMGLPSTKVAEACQGCRIHDPHTSPKPFRLNHLFDETGGSELCHLCGCKIRGILLYFLVHGVLCADSRQLANFRRSPRGN